MVKERVVIFPLKMVISHSYVSLPEGVYLYIYIYTLINVITYMSDIMLIYLDLIDLRP